MDPVMKPPQRGSGQPGSDEYNATIHTHSDHATPGTLPATQTKVKRGCASERFQLQHIGTKDGEEMWIMGPGEVTTKPPPLDTTTKVQSGKSMLSSCQSESDHNRCKDGKMCHDSQGGLDTIITTGQNGRVNPRTYGAYMHMYRQKDSVTVVTAL